MAESIVQLNIKIETFDEHLPNIVNNAVKMEQSINCNEGSNGSETNNEDFLMECIKDEPKALDIPQPYHDIFEVYEYDADIAANSDNDGVRKFEYVEAEYSDESQDYLTATQSNTANDTNKLSATELELSKKFLVYICPVCKLELTTYLRWREHLSRLHTLGKRETLQMSYYSGKKAQCKQCDAILSAVNFADLQMHEIMHLPQPNCVKCKLCAERAPSSSELIKHLKTAHGTALQQTDDNVEIASKPMTKRKEDVRCCPYCNLKFDRWLKMTQHVTLKHYAVNEMKIVHICPECYRNFVDEQEWLAHVNAMHDYNSLEKLHFCEIADKYRCLDCNISFDAYNAQQMRQHANEHMSFSRFKCKYCMKRYASLASIRTHMCNRLRAAFKKCTTAASADFVNVGSSELKRVVADDNDVVNDDSDSACQQRTNYQLCIKHVCPACGKELNGNKVWRKHLRTHDEFKSLSGMHLVKARGKRVRCLDCDLTMLNEKDVKLFHKFQHLIYKPYKCRLCDATMETYNCAYLHIVKCKMRRKTVNSNSKRCKNESRQKPEQLSSADGTITLAARKFELEQHVQFLCPSCPKEQFATIHTQNEHFRTVHNYFRDNYVQQPNGVMQCKDCQRHYSDGKSRTLRVHYMIHFERYSFLCRHCNAPFRRVASIQKHLEKHSFEAAVAEVQMPATANTNTKATDNAPEADPLQIEASDIVQVSKARMAYCNERTTVLNQYLKHITYACPECDEPLATQVDWHAHINNKHNFFDDDEQMRLEWRPDGTKRCKDCGVEVATSALKAQRHRLTHMPYRSFICAICYHRSNTQNVLIDHIRRRHFAPGAFKCVFCPAVLETAFAQAEHIKTHTHEEWPANICRICYRTLRSKWSLQLHMETHNLQRRDSFECEFCHRKYTSNRELNEHKHRMHFDKLETSSDGTVIIELKCMLCAADHENHAQLAAHFQTHDADELPETLCRVCWRYFEKRSNFSRHMRTHRVQQILKVEAAEEEANDLPPCKKKRSICQYKRPVN